MNSRIGHLFIICLLCLTTLGCDNKKTRAPIVQDDNTQQEANNVESMINNAVKKQREK